ncbi:MAG: VanZ family protein [candidate division WOR-3 bacterium]
MLILWIVIILFFTLVPTPESPKLQETGVDKILHFGAYTILGLIGQAAVGFHSLTIGLSLGTVTELLQYLIPHRTVEFFDWLANVLGLGLGIGAYFLVRKVL